MKVTTKEKTVITYTVKLSRDELTELHSELFDLSHVVDLASRPFLCDLLDTLRAQIHGI